jgi:hypothetical protein
MPSAGSKQDASSGDAVEKLTQKAKKLGVKEEVTGTCKKRDTGNCSSVDTVHIQILNCL